MAAAPVNDDTATRTVAWFTVAIVSGLFHPALGVVGAALAAWRSPRHRRWLLIIALL